MRKIEKAYLKILQILSKKQDDLNSDFIVSICCYKMLLAATLSRFLVYFAERHAE